VPDVNVEAVATFALAIACVAAVGMVGLGVWAVDASPKAIRHRRARRAFICPCGHDFVFHSREGRRECQRGHAPNSISCGCACQGYAGVVPSASLAELQDGAP
jgi:hypothetical protein